MSNKKLQTLADQKKNWPNEATWNKLPKYICAACKKSEHLKCTSIRQAMVIIETQEPSPSNLSVCICACFGKFISKEVRDNYNNRAVGSTEAQRNYVKNKVRRKRSKTGQYVNED